MILLIVFFFGGELSLRELIGCCKVCSKEVFCLDGFFNGVLTEEKEIHCFECYETMENKKENPQS